MAGERTFVVKFISDTAAAKAGLKLLSGDIKGFGNQVSKTSPLFGALAVGATAAFGAIAVGLTKAVKAAMEDQASQVELQRQLEKTFGANEALTQSAERYISVTQLRYGTSDVELRASLGTLVRATGDLTQSQDLLNLAQDISISTGKDLSSVSLALAKSSQGQFTALSKLGIPLDDNIKKSKDFGKVVDLLNDQFGGAAEAAANTFAGQLKILSGQFGEIMETIGAALLPYLQKLSKFLVENVAPAIQRVTTVIGEKGLVAGLQQLVFESGGAGIAIVKAAKVIALGFAYAYNMSVSLYLQLRSVAKAMKLDFGGAASDFAQSIKEAIDIGDLKKTFDSLLTGVDNYAVRGVPSAIRAQQGLLGSTEDLTGDDKSGLKGTNKTLKTATEKLKEYGDQLKKTESFQDKLNKASKSEAGSLTSLTDANTKLADAKAKLAQIERGFGAGSPEALEAQRDLGKAQRAQQRATMAVEEAIYSVADAEKNLAEIRKDPESSPMDIRRAELDLADAKLSVSDATDSQIESVKELNDQQKLLNETIFGATVGSILYDDALKDVEDAFRDQIKAFEDWETAVGNTKTAQDEFNASLQATADLIAKYPKVLGGMPNPLAGVAAQVPVTAGGGFALRPNDTYQININAAIAESGLPQKVVEALQQYNRSIGKIPVKTK
jgi:hypothetical protein